jgi:hypothetical protein
MGKRRKKRTSIDNSVRAALQKAFHRNSKPTSEEIRMISDSLNLDKEVVRVWFCNRSASQFADSFVLDRFFLVLWYHSLNIWAMKFFLFCRPPFPCTQESHHEDDVCSHATRIMIQ